MNTVARARASASCTAPLSVVAALTVSTLVTVAARADEGGVSFWLPGQYGSFAAIAPTPGFSLPMVSYFTSGSVGGNHALDLGRTLDFGVDGNFLGEFVAPSYAPDTTIFGGRPNFSLTFLPAASSASASVRLAPLSASKSQGVGGFGDLYPTAQLFWNSGVNNWMAYVTGDIPVGSYNADRLTNLGIGHGAVDFGGAYTFLNPNTGWEFSATAGLTFNFENPSTDYTNGIDAHLDWGAAKFLTQQLFVGAVGYVYQQLTPDRGQPAALGSVESATVGVGPQIGYNFDAHGVPIYANLRGYFDLYAENRLRGASVFLTLNFPLSALAKAK
ncbi:MAG TPA: transporter [Roseiarcus sp.]|nr:transporter [Roseiarcus sp.]